MNKETKNNVKANNSGKEKTPIEIYFENTTKVEPQSDKGKNVHSILQPVFEKIFDVKMDKKIINGVKLKEEFGLMLTYVFNKMITEKELNKIKKELGVIECKILEASGRGMSISKNSQCMVLTFLLNNSQKSGVDITF
jgi:hypothetical protein